MSIAKRGGACVCAQHVGKGRHISVAIDALLCYTRTPGVSMQRMKNVKIYNTKDDMLFTKCTLACWPYSLQIAALHSGNSDW